MNVNLFSFVSRFRTVFKDSKGWHISLADVTTSVLISWLLINLAWKWCKSYSNDVTNVQAETTLGSSKLSFTCFTWNGFYIDGDRSAKECSKQYATSITTDFIYQAQKSEYDIPEHKRYIRFVYKIIILYCVLIYFSYNIVLTV